MDKAWGFLKGRSGKGRPPAGAGDPSAGEDRRPLSSPSAVASAVAMPFAPSLDATGQRSEIVRVRVSQMAERLDEIKTLSDDFLRLTEPIDAFLTDYPRLQARVLESEALLEQEAQAGRGLRRDLDELTALHTRASDDLAGALAQVQRQDALLRQNESAIDELKLTLRDRAAQVEQLERDALAQAEQARTLGEEVQTLRVQAQVAEQAASRNEHQLAELRGANAVLEQDNERLARTAEDQSSRLAEMSGRLADLEQKIEIARDTTAALEAKLLAEQTARQRVEAQRETERANALAEAASLGLKVESVTSRLQATDKILVHAREQLRDRTDALRAAERAVADANAERAALERRLETLQQELKTRGDRAQDLQRANTELTARVDMLAKAMAAKDTQIESANGKVATLSGRLDQMTARFEQERGTLEAANRRLFEELQAEKAERSLAQGALNIARESRFKLQRQYAALKRRDRGEDGEPAPEAEVAEVDQTVEVETNVRRLQPPGTGD